MLGIDYSQHFVNAARVSWRAERPGRGWGVSGALCQQEPGSQTIRPRAQAGLSRGSAAQANRLNLEPGSVLEQAAPSPASTCTPGTAWYSLVLQTMKERGWMRYSSVEEADITAERTAAVPEGIERERVTFMQARQL